MTPDDDFSELYASILSSAMIALETAHKYITRRSSFVEELIADRYRRFDTRQEKDAVVLLRKAYVDWRTERAWFLRPDPQLDEIRTVLQLSRQEVLGRTRAYWHLPWSGRALWNAMERYSHACIANDGGRKR